MPEKKQEASAENDQDRPDEMSAEELAAFNKIMGDIGGGDDSSATESSDGGADDTPATNAEDDFSAELEKVVMEAGADSGGAVAGPSDASDEDELDADQQKAFESIMAQIGGGDASKADEDSGQEKDSVGSQPEEDDFAAELEKVVKEADGAETETETDSPVSEKAGEPNDAAATQEDAVEDADDSLDADQQEAFESIMAQIEGGKTKPESSEQEPTLSEARPPEEPEKTSGDSAGSETDGETEDISADIGDLLQEVAVEEEPSPSPDSDAVELVPEEEQAIREADEIEEKPEPQAEDAETESVVVDDQAEKSSDENQNAEETLPEENKAAVRKDRKKPIDDIAFKPIAPLSEAGQNNENKWKKIAIGASAVALLLLALVGYAYWPARVVGDSKAVRTAQEDDGKAQGAQTPQAVMPQPQDPESVAQSHSDQPRLTAIADSLEALRGEMLAKQNEIEELRTYYKTGIDAEVQDIVRTLSAGNKGKLNHTAAMADPRISLGMAAIQRRDTYIRKLEVPAETLLWNGEELLYLSRKASLLELMTTKTSDIDIDSFIGQAEEVIAKHTNALVKLNIDAVPASPLPMETIWKDIVTRVPDKTSETGSAISKADNKAISESICNGDFTQKHKLTELTAETARCLAKWKGKDLFLNEVKKLHPEAAHQLTAWKGEWLGLNGLDELSPESAMHLSRWKGKGLSLNGLTRLSPRVVAILSEWQGDQIELVNVKHMAHWENPSTRLFLSEELERKRNTSRN